VAAAAAKTSVTVVLGTESIVEWRAVDHRLVIDRTAGSTAFKILIFRTKSSSISPTEATYTAVPRGASSKPVR